MNERRFDVDKIALVTAAVYSDIRSPSFKIQRALDRQLYHVR